MLRDTQATAKRKGRRDKTRRVVRFPGLVTDAEHLGVHRNHLYLVLTGKRVSHTLTARYHQMKQYQLTGGKL
jgi:hypothetical protein